jgi:hypothetical protein
MNDRVWVNPRQPQTLYLAQILMYFRGGIALLLLFLTGNSVALLGSASIYSAYVLLDTVGLILAANGIANEKKWGYQLGLVAAFAPLVVVALLLFDTGTTNINIISVMFDVALVALLLHPMSVEYRRTWFR